MGCTDSWGSCSEEKSDTGTGGNDLSTYSSKTNYERMTGQLTI